MNVSPWKQKSTGIPSRPVSRNTCISEEEEKKGKEKAKCFPLPQGLEGTEGDT